MSSVSGTNFRLTIKLLDTRPPWNTIMHRFVDYYDERRGQWPVFSRKQAEDRESCIIVEHKRSVGIFKTAATNMKEPRVGSS